MKARAAHQRTSQVRPREIGAPEIREPEVAVAKVGIGEVGPSEITMAQVAPREARTRSPPPKYLSSIERATPGLAVDRTLIRIVHSSTACATRADGPLTPTGIDCFFA